MNTSNVSREQQAPVPTPHSLLHSVARGFVALRHRNFRLFFFGQLISLIGTWMQGLGQQWLVYVLTGSALNLGIVSAFQFLPVLLFSLLGGVVADRVPKRPLIICTQTASMLLALVLGLLTWQHVVQLWHIYLLAFLLGTVNAFDMPTRQAFVVEMVGREDLMNAIALNSSIFNGARVLGPAAGAFIINAVGIAGCFFLNALSFVAVIVGLFLMRLTPYTGPRPAPRNPFIQVGEGLRYIRSDRRVLLVFLLVSFISVFAIPTYTTLMPVIADQVLHVGVTGLGTLTSFLALGSVIAAISLAYTKTPEQRRFFISFGASTGCTLLLVFSFSRSFALSLALLAGVGFCIVASNATGNTIIQSYVPDHLRGRVMSVWSLVLVGLAPFGSFFAGSLAERTTSPLTIRVGALVCLAAAVIIVPQMLGWHWSRRKEHLQASDTHIIEHEGVQHGD
ncbi:MAG TPA: MFS transporter [Ktedonobacterales bacterium]|nr:MFS transporter [Ktedonobacterales bacterium]